MELSEYIAQQKSKIDNYLEDVFKEKLADTDKNYTHLYSSLQNFATKGKHLRGCFFLLSYEMAGGNNVDAMVPAAAAIEINGSALLIHDDIMDNDLLRRGGKSIFAQYIEKGKEIGAVKPREYGISSGILIGDIGIIMGFELLGRTPISPEYRDIVFARYAREMQITAVGQMMDYDFSSTHNEPTEEEILQIYTMKTAHYTMINPFLMGAQAAGASPEYCATLTELCRTLGVIFQIRDDVMGLMGDQKETGKAPHSDVRENKKTLIRRYLFEVAKEKDLELLHKLFGSEVISDNDFASLVALIKNSGTESRIEKKISDMANDALISLKKLSLPTHYDSAMKQLIHYSLTRTK